MRRTLSGVVHQQVYVIALPVHLHQPRLKVGADLGEDRSQFLGCQSILCLAVTRPLDTLRIRSICPLLKLLARNCKLVTIS